jgi:histone deacetylase 1/2
MNLCLTLLPFDIVHSDLWTSPTLSSGGHRYYILFLDDFTNFLWTFPIANKSQTYSVFLKFRNHIKTQFERDIKCFQCDNGKEYDNTSFHKFCEQNGMSFRFSCPHTSPQNGKAERKIRTINNMIRTLLAHASLPPSFWHHALQMATYLLNILPNKQLALETPTTILYHKRPSYSHLKVFGCLCFPLIPSTTRNKLQPRSTPCVFLGYPSNHRGYKGLELSSPKIIISRHVTFDETVFPFSSSPAPTSSCYEFLNTSNDFFPYHMLSTLTTHESIHRTPTPNTPQINPTPSPIPSASTLPPSPPSHSTPNNIINNTDHPQTSTSNTHSPSIIPTPTLSLANPQLSPQMTTRAQHGIFKPR